MVGHGRPRQQRGTNCGTAGYKAPEVEDLLAYSTEADMYSWGMCIYAIDSMKCDPPLDNAARRQVGMPTRSLCNVSYLSPYVASKGEGPWKGRTKREWGRGVRPAPEPARRRFVCPQLQPSEHAPQWVHKIWHHVLEEDQTKRWQAWQVVRDRGAGGFIRSMARPGSRPSPAMPLCLQAHAGFRASRLK